MYYIIIVYLNPIIAAQVFQVYFKWAVAAPLVGLTAAFNSTIMIPTYLHYIPFLCFCPLFSCSPSAAGAGPALHPIRCRCYYYFYF